MARIENHKYTIEEAFRECFYIVPDYQREYVWTEKEVQQLVDDITEQIDGTSNTEYFIGTILASPTGQKNQFDVIDGQQRLTTFFLMLCVLRRLFRGEPQSQTIGGLISTNYTSSSGDTVSSLKLDPRYENAGAVVAKIVELDAEPEELRAGINAANIPSFGSLENLVNAYATLYRSLKDNYEDMPALKRFWGYLANNVVFIQISADVGSALKIFETINERGVGLNPMDLLKNLLFTQVQPTEFTQLKDEWKKITKPLEKAKEKPLRFLRYFLMASYKVMVDRGEKDRSSPVIREDEIYDWFTKEENATACDYRSKPFEFVRKIIRNVELYLDFATGRGNDGQPSLAMANLKKLCGEAFSLHYVLLLAASPLPKNLFDHFVRQVESFLFYYIFTKTPTKDLERNFSLWADELRAVVGVADVQAQRAKLDEFIQSRFQSSMKSKEEELTDALRRYTLRSMQVYRTRYLLCKLTQHVDMAYKGMQTAGALDEYMVLEIEHILPNSPTKELRESFVPSDAKRGYDDYKNRLGNLTLLEKPLNIVASNDFFAKKLPEYAKCKNYLTSSLTGLTEVGKNSTVTRMNAKLKAFETWTPESIDERQEILIGLAKEIWRLETLDGRAG